MVDHVTEVGQWMVGVKRLIAETRNLTPDLLSTEQEEEEQEESNNNNTDSPVLDSL